VTWLTALVREDTRARRAAIVLAVLAFESWWFFADHYRGTVAFPYDFSQTYHAVPFYWQGAVRAGELPSWIPYQAFGYPMALNLQSGLFYPPMWIAPALDLAYSVRVAGILQCLHVVAAGAGAYKLARSRGSGFTASLLAAVAYSAFGGFFCNAQHPDIVRGYALLPWLLVALTFDAAKPWRRAWLVPPVVYFVMTGVYPGQAIAMIAFGFGFVALQIVEARLRTVPLRSAARAAAIRAAAIVVGLALCAVSLLPGFLLRGEISRVDEVGTLAVTAAELPHVLTTIVRYDAIPLGDLSMRSLFITIPVLFGLVLVRRRTLVEHASLIALAGAAVLMMTAGPVYSIACKLIPPLGYSRFPLADYRALVALPLLVVAVRAWHDHVVARDKKLGLVVGIALYAAFVLYVRDRSGGAFDTQLVALLAAPAVLAIVVLVRGMPGALVLALLVPLAFLDAHRMHMTVVDMWRGVPDGFAYKRFRRELIAAVERELPARPQRARARYQTQRETPDLAGYLRGIHTADDYAASEHFRVVQAIRRTAALADYVTAQSSPRVIAPATLDATATLSAPELGRATTVRYTTDTIEYELTLDQPGVLVENEPLFRGWRGEVDCRGYDQEPVAALWPLRAWYVPAGTRRYCVRYEAPGFTVGGGISLGALVVWLSGTFWVVRRSRSVRSHRPQFR
jgi:hypothetical protein